MSGEYEVLYTNFKTGDLLGAVPAISLTASGELNQPESISVTIPLVFEPRINTSVNVDTSTLHSLNNFEPAATAIFIVRNDIILFGGVLWGLPEIDFGAETMTLSASGMLSYLRRRTMRSTLSYTTTDQDTIARGIVDRASGVAIDTSAATAHGVTRDRTYFADRAPLAQRLSELAAVDNGFDFYFDHIRSGDNIQSHFRTLYPNTGRNTNSMFELHDLSGLRLSIDGMALTNFADVVGGSNVDLPIVETASNAAHTAKFPQLDGVEHHNDISIRSTLADKAELMLQRGAASKITATLVKEPEEQPSVGSVIIGDNVRFRAVVGAVNIDRQMRIVGKGISVEDDGRATESYTLVNTEVFI